ncbi:HEAT repeat domain-containing protein [Pseudomonas putida]|nr:HEAT repeat domain-containing protein [Pseudomonas putida]
MTERTTDNPDIHQLLPRLADTDAGVRRIALIELADLEDPDGLPWLTDALLVDRDPEVRAEAARLLEGWEVPEVVQALCAALADTAEPVRQAAAQSLSELKSLETGLLILPWAEHADGFVRASALRALRELRLEEAAAPALRALDDVEAAVRREAVGILGWLKHAPALPALARLATEEMDTEVRRAAIGALGLARDAGVLPALVMALRDEAWQVREEAATTLGKVGLGEAGPALVEALEDAYWQVRLRAARALGRLRHDAALEPLASLLGHGIANLRKEAALALGELGQARALPALQAAEADADPEVRKAVRIALAQLQGAV